MRRIVLAVICLAMGISAVGLARQRRPLMKLPPAAAQAITEENLLAHIKRLASDEFEGRAPATRGEELTINYIAEEFKKIGLAPGNPDGTYFQKVPLVGITASPDARLTVKAGEKQMQFAFADDFVAWTKRVRETEGFNADMVFVGYGVEAPEYGWDDYKGVDVRGKVLLMLINDPAVPDPKDPAKLDPKMFKGKAMTYYGRWSYKYEIAARKGAAGVLIIHETEPAGYGWDVVKGTWTTEQFDLVAADDNMSRIPIEGWISNPKAKEMFAAVGKNFDELKRAAIRKDFRPVELGARASLTLQNKIRRSMSNNVIGKLEGSDPKLKDEYVIYMGHWDHLGTGQPDASGDRIYNGAQDNATGTAGVIEVARAFRALPVAPRRTILFLAVTAEEKGLLGSKHYAENPLYPLARTLAVINMDMMNVYGRTRNVTVVGYGNSTLDDVLKAAAAEQGRVLTPDPEPEKGFYYRSDHFNFAKQGVPALYADGGNDYVGKPAGYAEKVREATARDYHRPSDEVKPDWDLSGMVEDLRLLVTVGLRVANTDRYPEWKPGTEFKAIREEMLRQAGRAR